MTSEEIDWIRNAASVEEAFKKVKKINSKILIEIKKFLVPSLYSKEIICDANDLIALLESFNFEPYEFPRRKRQTANECFALKSSIEGFIAKIISNNYSIRNITDHVKALKEKISVNTTEIMDEGIFIGYQNSINSKMALIENIKTEVNEISENLNKAKEDYNSKKCY